MVNVSVHRGPLTEDVVGAHNVVVFSHTRRSELVRWNRFCRAQSPAIGFIVCDVRGKPHRLTSSLLHTPTNAH